jgi:hypothetical protein
MPTISTYELPSINMEVMTWTVYSPKGDQVLWSPRLLQNTKDILISLTLPFSSVAWGEGTFIPSVLAISPTPETEVFLYFLYSPGMSLEVFFLSLTMEPGIYVGK